MRTNAGLRFSFVAYVLMAAGLVSSLLIPLKAMAQYRSYPSQLTPSDRWQDNQRLSLDAVREDDDFNAAELYRDAREDYQSGNYLAAMKHLRDLMDRYPASYFASKSPPVLKMLARKYRARITRAARARARATRQADRRFGDTRMDMGLKPRRQLSSPFDSAADHGGDMPQIALRGTETSDRSVRYAATDPQGDQAQLIQAQHIEIETEAYSYGPAVPKHLRAGVLTQRHQISGRANRSGPSTTHQLTKAPVRLPKAMPRLLVPPQLVSPSLEPENPRHSPNDQFIMATADRVFFGQASTGLGTRAREVVSSQARWLKDHPAMFITVNGHADEKGTSAFNMTISRQRAVAVQNLLLQRGIAPNRVSIQAHGAIARIATCGSALCAAQNRRVISKVHRKASRHDAELLLP